MTAHVQSIQPAAVPSASAGVRWQALYRIGGAAALLTLLTALVEILITFLPGGYTTASSVTEWFALLQANPFLGLRNLGLLNIVLTGLGIPLVLALYVAHRDRGALPALALIFSLVGTAIFYATNRAFPLLALSSQYAAAASAADRAALEAAGLAMLATGQSHTPGTFLAFFFAEVAGILFGVVLLRGRRFSLAAGLTGLAGYSLLLVYEIFVTFVPAAHSAMLIVALAGGLCNLAWTLLVAIRLFQPGLLDAGDRS